MTNVEQQDCSGQCLEASSISPLTWDQPHPQSGWSGPLSCWVTLGQPSLSQKETMWNSQTTLCDASTGSEHFVPSIPVISAPSFFLLVAPPTYLPLTSSISSPPLSVFPLALMSGFFPPFFVFFFLLSIIIYHYWPQKRQILNFLFVAGASADWPLCYLNSGFPCQSR